MTLLKLKAEDNADLETIAAVLQDSVVPMREMTFQPAERRFVLVASRFRWEDADGTRVEGRIYERIRCGVRFEHVSAVRVRDLDLTRRGEILSLLTVATGDGFIDLVFAAGGVIRMGIDRIACHLEDFDQPWPTQWRPIHPDDAGAA
jgi:hypothetical protein